eukprot:1158492-Pelagomonas_calceolata.AAC.3
MEGHGSRSTYSSSHTCMFIPTPLIAWSCVTSKLPWQSQMFFTLFSCGICPATNGAYAVTNGVYAVLLFRRMPGDKWTGLAQHVSENLADWKAVYDASEPHKCTLPYPWHEQLDNFQRMILIRAIRPDKVCTPDMRQTCIRKGRWAQKGALAADKCLEVHMLRLNVVEVQAAHVAAGTPQTHVQQWRSFASGMTLLHTRCLLPAITNYVAEEMGSRFVEPLPFSIEPSFNDSSAISPLVFVLSPGSDPMTSLLKFADDKLQLVSGPSLGPMHVHALPGCTNSFRIYHKL